MAGVAEAFLHVPSVPGTTDRQYRTRPTTAMIQCPFKFRRTDAGRGFQRQCPDTGERKGPAVPGCLGRNGSRIQVPVGRGLPTCNGDCVEETAATALGIDFRNSHRLHLYPTPMQRNITHRSRETRRAARLASRAGKRARTGRRPSQAGRRGGQATGLPAGARSACHAGHALLRAARPGPCRPERPARALGPEARRLVAGALRFDPGGLATPSARR